MADMIQIRRDTAANWTSANPTLAQGELGIETNTSKLKAGNGSTVWNSLGYLIDAGSYITATSTNTLTNKTWNSNAIGAAYGGTGLTAVGTSGNVLKSNGSVWVSSPEQSDAGGTVTSIGVVGGSTGLTTSGGPITTSGNITLAGTLVPANGGTGVTSKTGTGSVVLNTTPTLTTPVLSGITTTASGSMEFTPADYTMVIRGGGSSEGTIKLNCAANSHGQSITAQPHAEGITNEMLLPKGNSSTLVSEIGLATLTGKTIVDTVYALSGTAFLATNGGVQTKTVSANVTFSDSLVSGDAIVLMLQSGASYTVTWPTMQWVTSAGNVAPTLTAKDTIVLWKVGSILHGAYTGSYV